MSEEDEERVFPIAPKDVILWNPRLSEIRGAHDFKAADITALSGLGIVFVNDLLSVPKNTLQETYNSLPTDQYPARMSFDDFKATIKDLRDAFPRAHEFLAQPIRDGFVGRPDGGRDGSGMMF
jgi:hypothetical protein